MDSEVVDFSGAVIQSSYKDVPMSVFRTMSLLAFVMLLSLVAALLKHMLKLYIC